MGILINKKRCDNAMECSGIEACPTNAFYWDHENKTIAIQNHLCINCGACVISCPAGALKVYQNDEEYQRLKTEYDEDLMTESELFQDRYGAVICDDSVSLDIKNLDDLIKETKKALLIEFYNIDESNCLINSLPIKDIIEHLNMVISYRKINISDSSLIAKYELNELPSLIIIDKNKIIYRHSGIVDIKEKNTFLKELSNVKK